MSKETNGEKWPLPTLPVHLTSTSPMNLRCKCAIWSTISSYQPKDLTFPSPKKSIWLILQTLSRKYGMIKMINEYLLFEYRNIIEYFKAKTAKSNCFKELATFLQSKLQLCSLQAYLRPSGTYNTLFQRKLRCERLSNYKGSSPKLIKMLWMLLIGMHLRSALRYFSIFYENDVALRLWYLAMDELFFKQQLPFCYFFQ